MIRLEPAVPPLTPAEQFGWEVMLDLSRVLLIVDSDSPRAAQTSASAASVPARARPDLVAVRFVEGDHGQASDDVSSPLAGVARTVDVHDGAVVVPRVLLRAVADLAGAGVEQRSAARDRYARVPSRENPLAAAGRELEPVVSLAATALRGAIVQAAGRRPVFCMAPWPDGRRWAAASSHDVDVIALWPLFTALRVAELARKRRPAAIASVMGAALRQIAADPVSAGIRGVLEAERQFGFCSTWFVLSGTPSLATMRRGDLTYRAESRRARTVLGAIRAAGDEIGLHGSFATMDDSQVLGAQRSRLGRLTDEVPGGVRQHYLRMRPGLTQRGMVAAGFSYDATYGFPDRNGFRLGVADVVPAWDDAAGHRVPLDEVPLVWMDRAQSKYQNIEDPGQWIAQAAALAETSRRVEGLWVGLWHPNLTAPLGFPGGPEAYAQLLRGIAAEHPYIAPLGQIVAWRRLRRAVQGVDLRDRAVTVFAPARRSFDVAIEDPAGRVLGVLPRGEDAGGDMTTVAIALA